MLDLAGNPLNNFSQGVRIFLQSRNTILTRLRGGGRGGSEAANSRQRSPIAAHEVNTQTPCIQGNMGGVVAVFDARFEFSCRLRGELALRVWWFGHRKSTIQPCCIGKKKIEDFFEAPWSIQRACIDQNLAWSSGKPLIWTL